MAGVADAEAWTESTEMANGRSIALSTLTEDPRVSLLFMRLPDGGYPAGEGTAPQFESLMKLWNQGNGGSPAWPEITTVVGATPAATYTYQGLVDTLAEVIGSYEPRWIATQNYTGVFPVGSEEPVDHPDHVATAKFVREAQQAYLGFHQLIGYEDYETEKEAANVSGKLLEGKEKAFAAYEEHDMSCDKGESCEELYDDWLARQYRDASETRGVVANAGYAQTVDSEEGVSLDGSLSSAEEGLEPLAYEWRQVAGPAVALGGAETDEPSFAAPPAEASLAFSLTVSSGAQVSAPDVVSVEVEGPRPDPERGGRRGADGRVESPGHAARVGRQSLPTAAWLRMAPGRRAGGCFERCGYADAVLRRAERAGLARILARGLQRRWRKRSRADDGHRPAGRLGRPPRGGPAGHWAVSSVRRSSGERRGRHGSRSCRAVGSVSVFRGAAGSGRWSRSAARRFVSGAPAGCHGERVAVSPGGGEC